LPGFTEFSILLSILGQAKGFEHFFLVRIPSFLVCAVLPNTPMETELGGAHLAATEFCAKAGIVVRLGISLHRFFCMMSFRLATDGIYAGDTAFCPAENSNTIGQRLFAAFT